MINEYLFNDYVNVLSNVISFGLKRKYSFSYIEERICNSKLFKKLENNDDLIIHSDIKDIIPDVYDDEYSNVEILNEDIWIAMVYFMIFFEYQKPFSYIFTYLPLKYLLENYNTYHEEDFSFILNEFKERIKTNLLTKILENKGVQKQRLSLATSIKYDTIVKYCRSNQYLYNASYKNLIKIITYLSLDTNIFIEKLLISTNIKMNNHVFNIRYSYFLATLYKPDYRTDNFKFIDDTYYFDNNNHKIFILEVDEALDMFKEEDIRNAVAALYLKTIQMNSSDSDSLIIYETNVFADPNIYKEYDYSKYKNAILITSLNIYNLKNGKIIRIQDNDVRFANEFAKLSNN